MSMANIDLFPVFLRSYGNLADHLNSQLEGRTSKAKGDLFAKFTSRIIPRTEIGIKSEFIADDIKIQQHSYDDGVDIECYNGDKSKILYIQCKLSLKNSSDFDAIISKFENHHKKFHSTVKIQQQKLLHTDDEMQDAKKSEVSYMIVTLSNMERILPNYENSQLSSKKFYNELKNNVQVYVLDGPAILPILQSEYRKMHIMPTNLEIRLATPPLQKDYVYIGIISAQELKECYDKFGDALFFGNIRNFLGTTSGKKRLNAGRENVNEKIIETAEQEPDKMLARNNGITFRARKVQKLENDTLLLDDASIVNGCQTTMCLVQAPKPEAFVLVKIVEISDSWDIAKAANFQNRVEQIELELAEYIRPQNVKTFGNRAGFHVDHGGAKGSVYDVFDTIYQEKVSYEEVYYLFIGFFSRTINNVFNTNYNELRDDLLECLQSQKLDSEETFNILFNLYLFSQEGKEATEKNYKSSSYKSIFQRFWKEYKPNYRAFLTILAACGCTNTNIYDKSVNFGDFLRNVRIILENENEKFVRYYQYAFEAVAHRIMSSDKDENEILRTMYDTLRTVNFNNLYKQLRLVADGHEPKGR